MIYNLNKILNNEETYLQMDIENEEKYTKQQKNSNQIELIMLPSNLFNFVCMFLKGKDISNLMLTNRDMKEKVQTQAQYAISTIALKMYFGSEIDSYVEYGDEEKYLASKTQRNNYIADNMKNNIIDHLNKLSKLRSQIQQTPQIADLDQIFPILFTPPMPVMKIRRENVGIHAHSWFQNKLVDVYCERQVKTSKSINQFNFPTSALKKLPSVGTIENDFFNLNQSDSSNSFFSGISSSTPLQSSVQKSLGFFTNQFGSSSKKLKCFNQTISSIQQKIIRQKQIQNQNSSNCIENPIQNIQDIEVSNQSISAEKVEELLDLIRWYRDFDEIQLISNQNSPDVQKYISENQVVLTVLLMSNILKNQCQVFHEYLEQNYHNATYFDLISEYNLKWNIYQSIIIEIQENLDDVYKTFNELYQSEVGVKMYPQYTVLRVAAQHWARIVLKPLQQKLFEAFSNLLSNRRQQNLNYIMTNDINSIDNKLINMYYMPEKFEMIPSDLIQRYQKLTFQQPSENLRNYSSNQDSCNDKMYQEFFTKNSYYVDNILYSFCENMMDLSVNEASVHWLGHSEIQVGQAYSDLHELLIQTTSRYFEELYKQVFQGFSIEWKQFLSGELKYCRKIMKESTFKQINKLAFEHFFIAFTNEVKSNIAQIENKPYQISQFSSNEEQIVMQKFLSKGFSLQEISYLLKDPRSRKHVELFLEMKEDEEDLYSKSVRDEDIEDINRYRQIKQKLDEEQFAFYDLIGNIDHQLIEKNKNLIKQKQQMQKDNQQTQQKQNTNQNNHNQIHQNYFNNQQYYFNNSQLSNRNSFSLQNTNNNTHINGNNFFAGLNTNNLHYQLQQSQSQTQIQQQQQLQNNQYFNDFLQFSQSLLNNQNNTNNNNNSNKFSNN